MRCFVVIAVTTSVLVALAIIAPGANAQNVGKVPTLRLAWERGVLESDAAQPNAARADTGGFIALTTTKPERILVGGDAEAAHVIVVRDRNTGALLWRRDAPPVVGAGKQTEQIDLAFTDASRVYIRRFRRGDNGDSNKAGALDAHDGRTGKRLWSVSLGGASGDAMARTNGANRVYLVGGDAKLRALDAATGREMWTTTLPFPAQYIAAISNKHVVVSLGNDVVLADKETGAVGGPIQPSKYLRRDIRQADWTIVKITDWLPASRVFLLEDASVPPAGGEVEAYGEILNENLRFLRWGDGEPTPSGDGLLHTMPSDAKGEPKQGRIVAEDARTGRRRWSRSAPPPPFHEFPHAAWRNVNVILRAPSEAASERNKPRTLLGVDPHTGASLWSLRIPPGSEWETRENVLLVWLRDEKGRLSRVRAYLPFPDTHAPR